MYYIPEFITETEEAYLLKRIYDAPLPRWTQLSNRRLQNWGGDPHPKGMIAEEMPEVCAHSHSFREAGLKPVMNISLFYFSG